MSEVTDALPVPSPEAPPSPHLPDAPQQAEQAVEAVTQVPDWARDPDVLERILHAALQQGDIEGVGHALRFLLACDPRRGLRLHDELKDALVVAKFLGGR